MVQKPEGIGTVPEEVVTSETPPLPAPTAHVRKLPVTKKAAYERLEQSVGSGAD